MATIESGADVDVYRKEQDGDHLHSTHLEQAVEVRWSVLLALLVAVRFTAESSSLVGGRSFEPVVKLSVTVEISGVDRDVLPSFRSNDGKTEYAPQSIQITSILKQMQDTMQSELDKATAEEEGRGQGEANQFFDQGDQGQEGSPWRWWLQVV